MISLSDQQTVSKFKYLGSPDASKALEALTAELLTYYTKQCIENEGTQLYRDQGAAKLVQWLQQLPKALRSEL